MSVHAFGVELNKPNTTITEFVTGFDREPERAEKEAQELASARSINSDYETKTIIMDVSDGVFYCRMLIKHDIYTEPDQVKNQQAAIGYGNSCERAYDDARTKAEAVIAKSNRQTARINERKDDRAQTLSRANPIAYWIKAINLEKFGSTWTCILKFEYLKDKES